MHILDAPLNGVLLIKPNVFEDSRGFFYECFHSDRLSKLGITLPFVQDNLSHSTKNTIRGLHYQAGNNPQGKLCQVIDGSVLDVTVDIRFNSPTFGKYFSTKLSAENHNLIWIPPGFAHGFSVLSKQATFHYKCTGYYHKPDERTILYNDTDLNIDWVIDSPIVSDKDLSGIPFTEIAKEFLF